MVSYVLTIILKSNYDFTQIYLILYVPFAFSKWKQSLSLFCLEKWTVLVGQKKKKTNSHM